MRTSIETVNGVKYIAVDGKIIDTLSFKSFRPTKNNISDFYNAGIRIFHVYCSGLMSGMGVPYSQYGETWFGDGDYRFENLDRQIDFFMETAPDAYYFINVHLDVRQWWRDNNPGSADSFRELSQIAGDEQWRYDTGEYLKALIRHTEEKYNDRVCGYFLLGGYTTEWFSQFDHEETHPTKLAAFRKYMSDDTIDIPPKEELEKPENQIFLDPSEDKIVIDYRKFHNNLISDLVLYYAACAQEVLNHTKVVGMFFGYIMELLGPRLWNAGHLAIDKVYRSPDLDLLATPSSYQFRLYDDASAYMLLSDSIELNDMMYFDSFDHFTFLVPTIMESKRRICGDSETGTAMANLSRMRRDLLSTREQTIDGIRREIMQRLARRTGMWWFDMMEGWFYDDGLMDEVSKICAKSKSLLGKKRESNSEIAVFVSCESLYYVNKCSKMNTELICNQRDALARIGAPYDLYSMGDIDRIDPDKYKLFIFLDAFYLTDEQREYINNTIKSKGRSILFIGACDYVNDNGFSMERMESMSGMKLEVLDKDEEKVNACDSIYGYSEAKSPTFYVSDTDTETIGRFNQSRKCALAKKSFNDHTMYYSAIGNISAAVFREIARESNIHIYAENDTPTFVNSGFVGVYNTRNEYTKVHLTKDGEFEEIFSGKKYKSENGIVTLPTGECPAQMLVLIED